MFEMWLRSFLHMCNLTLGVGNRDLAQAWLNSGIGCVVLHNKTKLLSQHDMTSRALG